MSDNLEPSLRQELICCGGVDSKWDVARLELDVKVELSDSKSQKLSGQVRETSAQEMLCLTVRPPAQMFDTGLRTLREHITQLYRAPEGSRLPAVVDMDRWAEEASSPLLPRHPALPALFAITAPPEQDSSSCEKERPIRMAFRYHSHSLRSVLSLERYRFTAGCLDVPGFFNHADHLGAATDMRLRFLFYQVLRALSHLHELGSSLGGRGLTSMDLRVTDSHWVCLPPAIHPSLLWPPGTPPSTTKPQTPPLNLASSLTLSPTPSSSTSTHLPPTAANTTSGGLLRMGVAAVPRSMDSRVPLTEQWASGRLSNLGYLLALNRAVGRSTMDARLPSLFPWVSDLSAPWGGWRDLGKSKLRLTKGDEFLDMTFRQQQQHPNSRGHHVDECLSELCYYMYEARRAPMGCLRRAVRSNFVAAQYPHSVQRLVEWTQDEATVAFYTDPSVLRSKHKSEGLQDLALPSWLAGLCARQRGKTFKEAEPPAQEVANEEEEEEAAESTPYAAFGGDGAAAFVAYHRALLESDHVSRRLHEWIDLYFGASLIGNRALLNKNVPLNPASQTSSSSLSSSSSAAAAAAASRAPSGGGGGGGNATRGCLVGLGLECRPRLVPLFTHPHPPRRCAFTSPSSPLPAAAAAVSSAAAVNAADSGASDLRAEDSGGVPGGGGVVSALRVKADAGFVAAARQRADYDAWMGGQQRVRRRSSSRSSSSSNDTLGGSNGVGWKAATVEKWVMDMVLTPDVLAADAAAAASAPASAAAATAQGRGDRQHFAPLLPSSPPPPFSLSGGGGGLDLTAKLGADASADELLLRCAPQILLPANTPTLPGHHHRNSDNETGNSLAGALGGLENLDPFTRCCGVDLCEVEGRTSFAQGNDAIVNPYSLQAQGANSAKGLDSTQPSSLSAARKQTDEEVEEGDEEEQGGGWLSLREVSLLKAGDALAAGLLLGELVAGRPLFSAAQVAQHQRKTAARSPRATAAAAAAAAGAVAAAVLSTDAAPPSAPILPTVDLRELLLHSSAGLSREVAPPPVFAAVRGLLHPNPHRRLTVDQVLAANGVGGGGGGAGRDEEDAASLERGEGEESGEGELQGRRKERKKKDALRNKQSNSWCPPSLKAAAATTRKSRHRHHHHNFMRSCDDGCSGSSGGYDDEDKKDCAALAALFPPYFNPLYAFVAKVVACEQEADAIFLDSVPDTNTAATSANTGTAEGESAGDFVNDKGLSKAVGRSEAGLGHSKDERIARCRLEALVVTLEALPELVANLPPLGLAMALPHILNSLLGSSTPYVFAHEDIRRRDNLSQLLRNERSNSRQAPPHSASGGGGETANATAEGGQGSTEAALLRAALCLATSPVASFTRLYDKQQQQRSDAGGAATPSPPPPPPSQAVNTTALPPLWWRHSLVLHLPCAVALLGKRLGPEATQLVLLPRLTAFLEAGSWHPSLLLPLLTGLSSSTNNSITTATSTAAASASSAACGKNKKRQLGVGLGAVPCRPHGEVSPSLWGVVAEVGGGWAALLHHLLPLAFNWLDPAHVELQMCLRLRMRRHRTTIAAPSASSPLKTRITGNSEDADRDDQEAGEVVEDCDDDGDDGDDSEDSEEEGGGEGCGLRTNGVNFLTTSRRALLRQLTFEVPRAAAAMLADLTSKHLGPVLSLRYLLPPLLHRLGSGSRAAASTSAAGAAAAPPPPPLLPAAPRGASKKKEAKKAVPVTAEAVVLVCHACTVTATGGVVTGGGVGQQRAHTHAADAVKLSLDHCLRADGKGLLTRLERALSDEEQQRQRQQEQQRGSGGQGNSQTAGETAVASSGGVYESLFEVVALLRGLLTRQPTLLGADTVCEYYLAAQLQSPQSSSSKKKSHAKEGQLRKEQTRRRRSVGELLLLLLPTREALEARLKAEKQCFNLFSSAAATTAIDDGGRIEHESEATAMAARRPDLELLRDATSLLGEVCLHLACDKSCQAMIVGLVLPHVEKFFAMFAHLYGPYLLDAAAAAAGGAAVAAVAGDGGGGVAKGPVLETAAPASSAACLWGEVGAMLDVARALYLSIASMAGFDTLARHVPSAKRVRAFLGAGANLPAGDDGDADARRADASSTPETVQDAHHPSSSSSYSTSKSKDSSANKWDLFSSGREVDNAPPDALELMGKGLKWFKKKTDKHLLGKDPKRHHAPDPPQPPSPTSLLLGMISNGQDGSSSNSSTVVVGGDDSDGEGGGGGGNIDDDEEEESAAWLIREAHTMNFSPPNQLDKTASSIRDGDDDEEVSDDGGNPFLASDEEGCGEEKEDVVTGKDDSDDDAGGGAGRRTVYRQNSDEPPFHVDTTIKSGVEVGTANDEDDGGSGEDVEGDGDGDDEDKHSAVMELGSLPDFRQKVIRERIRRNSEGGPTGANAAGITTAAADQIPTQEKAGDSSLSSFPASRELQKARQQQQQQQQGRVVMGSSKPHRRFRRWEMDMCQAPLEARSSGGGGRVVPTPFALQLKVVATVDSSSGSGEGGGEVGSGGVGGGSGGEAREAWRGVDNVVRTMVSGESMRGHTVSGSLHKAATNSSSISTGVGVDDDTAALLLASNHVGRGSLPSSSSSSSSSPVLSAASSASGNSHGASARAIGGVGLFEGMDIGVFGGGEAEATPSPSPPPPPSASKVDGGVGDVVSAGGDVLAFAAASASSVPSSGNSSSNNNDKNGNSPSNMPNRSGGSGSGSGGGGGAAVVGAGEATTDRGIRVMATDAQETVLLSAHRGGAVTVHSLRCLPELRKLSTYRAHGDGVVAAVLFPGARLAASCDLEGSLHVWDVETAKTLEVWRGGFSRSAAARTEGPRRRSGGGGGSEGSASSSNSGGGARRGGVDAADKGSSSSSTGGCGSSSVGSSSSSSGGAKQLRSAIFPKQHGAMQAAAGGSSVHMSHGLRTRGPYVALASMQADSVAGHHSSAAAAWNAWSRVGRRRRRSKEEVQFGVLSSRRRNEDEAENEQEYSREEEDDDDSDSNDGLWVGECPEASSSTQWQGSDHQLLAATPSMLHVFDLRASSHQQRREGSSSGGAPSAVVQRVQLVARCEWALSADSTLVDPDRDDAFKGPGLRCVGVGRSDGSGDPWLFAGGGTGRSWVVDRRTGKVLFDWQAHGVVSGGAGGFGDFMNAGSVGGDGGGVGGAGGMAGHSGGGACTGGMVGGGNVSSGGSGGMGSGGGGAFGGGGGGDIRNAVLSIVSGSARHTCVTTSYDQTCCVWDLSGSLPKRLSTLKGLPSVSTAGVMGAHLHSSTVHIHDFLASSEGDNHSAVGADFGPGSNGPPRTHSSSSSLSPSSPPCRQVLFACAGHKVTVAPLPSLAQGLEAARNQAMQHGGGAGVAAEAPVRYFNDRSGHKFHRHHLTTKASVVLPLWRMMLLGGSDDKIRVCV